MEVDIPVGDDILRIERGVPERNLQECHAPVCHTRGRRRPHRLGDHCLLACQDVDQNRPIDRSDIDHRSHPHRIHGDVDYLGVLVVHRDSRNLLEVLILWFGRTRIQN